MEEIQPEKICYFKDDEIITCAEYFIDKPPVIVNKIIRYSKYNDQGYRMLMNYSDSALKTILDREYISLARIFNMIFVQFGFPVENIAEILSRLNFLIEYCHKKSFVHEIKFVHYVPQGTVSMFSIGLEFNASHICGIEKIGYFVGAFNLVQQDNHVWSKTIKN